MNELDISGVEFRHQLHEVAEMVADLYSHIDQQKVYGNPHAKEVRALFTEPLPEQAESIGQLLNRFKREVIPNSTKHYSPHFYPWVTSCATQVSILGDFLATALNVNATTWMNSAAASEIERQSLEWIGQFSGYDAQASGVFVSGGSTANLTGLQMARLAKAGKNIAIHGLADQAPYTVYTSTETHFCIDKSMDVLGLGKKYLRKIPAMANFQIDIHALERQIQLDIAQGFLPICVVGNAGTVNTGAIDPLDKLYKVCQTYHLWFHIDAAYAGCAANLSLMRDQFKGFSTADSVAIDLHKWFYVPFEASCVLVKDKEHLRDTFKVIPEYQKFEYEDEVRIDYSEYSFQQSRNFKALKVWMNFKAYGRKKLSKAIENNILTMRYLSKLLEEARDFEFVAGGLSIVCFRYLGNYSAEETDRLNLLNKMLVRRIEVDQRVFIRETRLHGKLVLRGCCTNFRREKRHVAYLVEVLRELGEELLVELQNL